MIKVLHPFCISSTSSHSSRGRSTLKRKDVGASSAPTIRRPGSGGMCDLFRAGSLAAPPVASPRLQEPSVTRGYAQHDAELETFLQLFPPRMRRNLSHHAEIRKLIEVVMDLGRRPVARFPSGDWFVSEESVVDEDLHHAVSKVGEFSDDNRSGINRSLHRISAIRNRKKQIIGLTCRVGRAITGAAAMITDLVESGASILVIGPPGVGKTTLIREIARMLADEQMKRVVIVDTSNEIGGDGDVPHSGIGRARRMQVPNVNLQHNVMIEAIENHMPEVIIIDEISTELESLAACTIAQRGVQLVGTAHGVSIESVVKNPCLQSLVGGIESVTLGDDEARRRKVQKTILERKGPPTFTCAVEMTSNTECRVHHRLEETVDFILAGKSPHLEVRKLDVKYNETRTSISVTEKTMKEGDIANHQGDWDAEKQPVESQTRKNSAQTRQGPCSKSSPVRVYTYKIIEADLLQVAHVMGLENDLDVAEDLGAANAILALKSEIKHNPWIRSAAKFHQLPVFVIKENTMAQMVKAVKTILGMNKLELDLNEPANPTDKDIEIEDDSPKRRPSMEEIDALEEVRLAIEYIVIPGGEPVELLPRCSEIIARQLELVESYQLAAERSGTELNSRLQILPQKLNRKPSLSTLKHRSTNYTTCTQESLEELTKRSAGAGSGVTRLPLLPY